MAFTTVPSGATRLLVIAFQGFRHVVVNDVPDVRFVDAHAKCDGRHDVHVLHQELVWSGWLLASIPACTPGLDAVNAQDLRNFFHLFRLNKQCRSCQHWSWHGARPASMHLFGADFVKQVFTVKRRLKSRASFMPRFF